MQGRKPRVVGMLVLALAGCTSMMATKQQTITMASPRGQAYTCAVQTMLRMGGTDLRTDTQGGIASCTLHKAIALTARVHEDAGQSHIDVTGTPIPGLVAVGNFNEVEQFVSKVQECQ